MDEASRSSRQSLKQGLVVCCALLFAMAALKISTLVALAAMGGVLAGLYL